LFFIVKFLRVWHCKNENIKNNSSTPPQKITASYLHNTAEERRSQMRRMKPDDAFPTKPLVGAVEGMLTGSVGESFKRLNVQ
jgi:hypothetical protein